MSQGQITDAIDDLLAHLAGFEQGGGSLQTKDLCDPGPSVGKPCIEVGTARDRSMFEAAMSFLPGFGLFAAPIEGRIREKRRQIHGQGGLIVFGNQDVGASTARHLRTQFGLGMHGVEGENPPGDERGRQQRLERADLVLFLLDIDLKQHHPGADIVGAQLVDRMGFLARGSHGFAINGDVGMLPMPGLGLQPTGFVPAALLGLPPGKERHEQLRENLGINDL